MIQFEWDENKNRINIISARKATRKEEDRYVRGI